MNVYNNRQLANWGW